MEAFGEPEKVYVEMDWYDGPRSGVADVNGVPHYLVSFFDEDDNDFSIFTIWTIKQELFDLEIEQWQIFVEWNDLYESGRSAVDSHPAHGGINKRYDEIETHLKPHREKIPVSARRAKAKFERINRAERYCTSGPDYLFRWHVM